MTPFEDIPLVLDDPLVPYLVELMSYPQSEFAILAGGFGLRLRLARARSQPTRTLIPNIPQARATQDLDLFMSLDLWLSPDRAMDFRKLLDDLGYQIKTHNWQFKSSPDDNGKSITVDLQARNPEGLPIKVERNKGRPNQVGGGMKTGATGFETLEGFAVEDSPQTVNLMYDNRQVKVKLPHPYAWLNLKIRAAYDWLREERGEIEPKNRPGEVSTRLKHPFDVYSIIASLTETELNECAVLAQKYRDHEQAKVIRQMAIELYGEISSPGTSAIRNYARVSGTQVEEIDHDLFFGAGLKEALGL